MSLEERDFDWFLEHKGAYDALTVEQLHILGQGGKVAVESGDTATVEPVVADSAAENSEAPAAVTEPASTEPESSDEKLEPVVLAKDGEHTIPYSEFEAARHKAARVDDLERMVADQKSLIESLQAAKSADADTGGTANQDEFMKEFETQYPEIAKLIAPALQQMIDAGVAARTTELEAKLSAAIKPLQETAVENEIDAHFEKIIGAVPDFIELRDSGKVDAWVKSLPTYARDGAMRIMYGVEGKSDSAGTADEVIELFTQYKNTLKTPEVTPEPKPKEMSAEEAKTLAAAAVLKAKSPKPTSLTDVPAGTGEVGDGEPTTVEGWSQRFSKMTPEQILAQL